MALRDKNPKIIDLQPHKQEIGEQISNELSSLGAGRIDNLTLLQSLMHNWSYEQFAKVAKSRGQNWRFLAALADRNLEVQGVAMLRLVAEVIGNDFTRALALQASQVIVQMSQDAAKFEELNNPYIIQIYEQSMQSIAEWNRAGIENLRQKLVQMLEE